MSRKYTILKQAIDAVNAGQKVPPKIGDFRIKWTSTDGWRGYYTAEPVRWSDWTEEDSDWVTGDWSNAGENASSSVEKRLDEYAKEMEKQNREMVVIFVPTSNVFATAFQVFSREKKEFRS